MIDVSKTLPTEADKARHTPGPLIEAVCGTIAGLRYKSAGESLHIQALNEREADRLEAAVRAQERIDNAAPDLLAACKHAAQDAASRLYVMPVDIDPTERFIVEAQLKIYRAAIAKATA